MITERDLQEAIAECQGKRNPNANTCMMLAAFYTIKDHLFPEEKTYEPQYSFDMHPTDDNGSTISYYSETEFGQAVQGKNTKDIMTLIDEVMTTLSVVNPRLYASIIARI